MLFEASVAEAMELRSECVLLSGDVAAGMQKGNEGKEGTEIYRALFRWVSGSSAAVPIPSAAAEIWCPI